MSAALDVRQELETLISKDAPLNSIVDRLKCWRGIGVTRSDVQSVLEQMRGDCHDEASEDRILEVMDIVAGFCHAQISVWD